jgi:hypothetical protein
MDDRGTEIRFPAGKRHIFPSPQLPARLQDLPSFLSKDKAVGAWSCMSIPIFWHGLTLNWAQRQLYFYSHTISIQWRKWARGKSCNWYVSSLRAQHIETLQEPLLRYDSYVHTYVLICLPQSLQANAGYEAYFKSGHVHFLPYYIALYSLRYW